MSYEYSATTGRMEIPNPYRFDNLALFFSGGCAALTGLWLVISERQALTGADPSASVKGLVIGLLLLAAGLIAIGRGLTQLRYFFGRGRPKDLTDSWPSGEGTRAIAETLRQGALNYKEPHGAMSGLVHKLLSSLIFAPQRVRYAAESQFANLLLTAAFFIGLAATYFFYPMPAIRAWTAVVFALLAYITVLGPFLRRNPSYARARSGVWLIVLIIVVPVLLPPLLSRLAGSLPDPTPFNPGQTLLIAFAIMLVAQALFFLALLRQLRPPPAINMACEQRTPSLNANPAKVFEELERLQQSRWVDGIPNRRYFIGRPPDAITQMSGSFRADLLEESQPLPAGDAQPPSIGEMLQLPATRWIALLTLLGAATYCAAVVVAALCGRMAIGSQQWPAAALLAVVLALTGHYCRLSARELWSRVDFTSLLLWVEISGSYETADMQVGNQLSTGMMSAKRVINVESMTLRVWAAEIDTVIFGKDDVRDWIGMRGRPDVTRLIADHLEAFAARAPSIVAPTSSTDLERINALAQIQRHLAAGAAPSALPLAVAPAVVASDAAAGAATATAGAPGRCPNGACGRPVPADAVFCSACGTRLR